jgi:DNA polymerase-3 subunit gamma/tau
MSYKVLYRKYRPTDFENVVGQDYTVSMLKNALISGKNSHAYIFTGPRGTGKTSTAKIFAKALNCENPIDGSPCNKCASCLSFDESPDIIEIDAASNNGVGEIRELIDNVKLVPSSLKYKVYIIDEVHMLTESAFNALLLTLEEPPSHVVFILATTDIQDVPITILSRCQRFDFKPIDKLTLINRLKYVSKQEKIKIDDDALEEIALIAAGGMRDALGMLDQLAAMGNKITLDMVASNFGSVSTKKIDQLIECISLGNITEFSELIGSIRDSGTSYSVFVEKLILELRKCAIEIKLGNSDLNIYFEDIYKMILDLNDCLCNININVDPYILIEICLLKYINNPISNTLGNKTNTELVKETPVIEEKTKEEKPIENNIDNNEVINMQNEEKTEEDAGNNISENEEKVEESGNKSTDINLEIRVNNTFVDVSMDCKKELNSSWVDFMNFLMDKNRNLLNKLSDTSILAASPTYALIQSKIDSTNDLINSSIKELEKCYQEYSGKILKFAALNVDIWNKEKEKYRLNRQKNIKYNYIDEGISDDSSVEEKKNVEVDDIEALASDIFDSYEVE